MLIPYRQTLSGTLQPSINLQEGTIRPHKLPFIRHITHHPNAPCSAYILLSFSITKKNYAQHCDRPESGARVYKRMEKSLDVISDKLRQHINEGMC